MRKKVPLVVAFSVGLWLIFTYDFLPHYHQY
jgi:hypothetical protein